MTLNPLIIYIYPSLDGHYECQCHTQSTHCWLPLRSDSFFFFFFDSHGSWTQWLCLSSALHPSEEHLKSVPVWSSSRCSFFSLFLEDAPLRSFVASHIPRFFARPKKKKEREKMATSRGVDRHFRGPGRQKSWRKGKTSGDATRKCSKGSTVTFNTGWPG